MSLSAERWIVLNEGGQEAVYLFYYPTYRDCAEMNDVTQWPCKIGRTDVDPRVRVEQQLNSSSPEKPILALVFQCDNSRALESTIHNYMKLHRRHFNHSFNKEWFNTNPDEVCAIVSTLTNPLLYDHMYDIGDD